MVVRCIVSCRMRMSQKKQRSADGNAPKFPAGETSVNVYGWYPYNSASTSFSIKADQTSNDNYCLSDLMLANKAECTRNLSSGEVTAAQLSFRHVMSKVKVVLNPTDVTVTEVKLVNVKPTVNINETNVSSLTVGEASGTASEEEGILLNNSTNSITSSSTTVQKTLCGVFPAQTITGSFLKVTANGTTITYSFSGEGKTFAQDNEYQITLNLSQQSLSEQSVSLSDWEAQGNNPVNIGSGGLRFNTTLNTDGYVTLGTIPSMQYTGSAIMPEPSVSVYISGTNVNLQKNRDFTYGYTDNTNVGSTAKVTITGMGVFSGSVSKNFTIVECTGTTLTSSLSVAKGGYICSHSKYYASYPSCGDPIARIVKTGKVEGYFEKFLAIALEDVGTTTYTWANGLTAVNTWAAAHSITIDGTTYGEVNENIRETYYDQVASDASASSNTRTSGVVQGWRMPSVTDWKYVLEGCGGKTYVDNGVNNQTEYSTGTASGSSNGSHRALLNVFCGQAWDATTAPAAIQSDLYWSSSEYSSNSSRAWYYSFYNSKWSWNGKTGDARVRAVFAY